MRYAPRVRFTEEQARRSLGVFRNVLAGKGCMCVQSGEAAEVCPAVRKDAPMARDAYVQGHPELQAELRAAAERILAKM